MLFDQEPSESGFDREEILAAVGAAAQFELAAEALSLDGQGELPAVALFTDGGSSPNPGPGGWAFILRLGVGTDEQEVEGAGAVPATTNNRMELTAVIRGLLHLDRPCAVQLIADSEYVVKGLTEWLAGWKKRGWKNAKKKPVLNDDLWRILDRLAAYHQIRAEWTKGHAGHPENERCDELVGRVRAELKDWPG
ncbi:MAG: ribonuclease HI [Pirellulaceae bacterium]|nr:ribonuclease HI [Pirellulaceae bacterium]